MTRLYAQNASPKNRQKIRLNNLILLSPQIEYRERDILCSMSAAGYCYDNATCESFFATLKRESFPENCVFDTKAEARRRIFEYIETFYNRRRIHTSLGNRSPDEVLTNYFQRETITLN